MFFETFVGKDDQYYFNFRFGDGVILKSEGYTSKESRDNGIESVKENGTDYDMYTISGKYFNLKAKNGQIIGSSVAFTNEDECESIIKNMIDSVSSAPIMER